MPFSNYATDTKEIPLLNLDRVNESIVNCQSKQEYNPRLSALLLLFS